MNLGTILTRFQRTDRHGRLRKSGRPRKKLTSPDKKKRQTPSTDVRFKIIKSSEEMMARYEMANSEANEELISEIHILKDAIKEINDKECFKV